MSLPLSPFVFSFLSVCLSLSLSLYHALCLSETLFVCRNLMLSTTEDSLRVLFNRKGNNDVERVKKTKVRYRVTS